ncbi:MAG: vitamin B12-dependent ribonucleotide reductase [Calditrichaeota bacterium]|nr:vitamin B12-dependent ribonucleotide reductase [Calditrichota bacterium]
MLSENAITILKRRYLKKDSSGNPTEEPREMFWRVARTIASNETKYNPEADVDMFARELYETISRFDFVPNSPTLMNAGRKLGQLSACFVLPVDDSMEGIFDAVKNAAMVHKSGGGTGFSFSRIRPKSSHVASTAGTASGPVSFMWVFNAATETIKQGGTRRGANMGILRIDHPDILEFIECKKDMVSITNFNISVAITDAFMEAVKKGEPFDLISPHNGDVVGQLDARETYDLIANNAWFNGDPGMVFIDEINRHEVTPKLGAVEATNPCGEQPLLPYESCNLGSVNLNNMLTDDLEINWTRLKLAIRHAVRFLDNIIDLNKYPLEKIREMTYGNRRIGLGLMGFADMLYALKIPYDSEDGLEMARKVMKFIQEEGRQMSNELSVERGTFPNFGLSTLEKPSRNSTVTTIAPTGTISMIADVSGGIEPNFAICYVKRVMDDDRLLYVNQRFEEAARDGGWYSQELMDKIADGDHLSDLEEVPEDVKRVFKTAHDISPDWHIRMQAAFQEYTDNAVSKTINFPNSATVQDIKDSFLSAWDLKCKGMTIYRDGSRDVQVMNVGDSLKSDNSENPQEINKSDKADINQGKQVKMELPTQTTMLPKINGTVRKPPGSLKPRKRPRVTRGYTEQIETGEGTLYVTINEDEHGLCEVFASIGKSGGNAAAQSEAIGRLISLALRAGIDPRAIVKQLKGITGTNPVWHDGDLIRSTPDGIGRSLERFLNDREHQQAELPLDDMINDEPSGKPIAFVDESKDSENGPIYMLGGRVQQECPECGFAPLSFEEGCLNCRSCGYSKCG